MGAHLVNLALARWAPHISDTAFRVLVRMALVALDSESENGRPAGLYFGGRELLAMTLRCRDRTAALRMVRRAVNELVKAGAVERVGKAHTGHRQTYRLTLDSGYPLGELSVPPVGVRTVPPVEPRGGTHSPERGYAQYPPRNQEEPQPLGAKQESTHPREVPHDRAHASAVPTPQDRSDKRDDVCPDCGAQLDPDGTCFVRTCTRYGRTTP
jgi:hypothetical protein